MDLIAYKYRVYPNNEQALMLAHTFGCVRFKRQPRFNLTERETMKNNELTNEITVENFNYQNVKKWIGDFSHKEKVQFACDCAELVIDLYKGKSDAPKLAIKAVKDWILNPSKENKVKCKSSAAAAVRAATYADSASYASYAASADAARAAAAAADYADADYAAAAAAADYAAADYAAAAAAYAAYADASKGEIKATIVGFILTYDFTKEVIMKSKMFSQDGIEMEQNSQELINHTAFSPQKNKKTCSRSEM